MPRFYCPPPWEIGTVLDLPASAARHVQVLRLQPSDTITLFDGTGAGEWDATITHMGRSTVQVRIGACHAINREPAAQVHLAVGMPANERMDWLIEKATELGVTSIQPLMTERTVLRLSGERAEKKVAHWQSIAIAACEQCGGNRVPTIHPVQTLAQWLQKSEKADSDSDAVRLILSLADGTQSLHAIKNHKNDSTLCSTTVLSGPEGGLSPTEEAAALERGFIPVTLGARVLRAETAALAALVGWVTC